jgi:hypothetical protein
VCLLTLQLIRYAFPFQGDLHTPRKAYFSLRPRRTVIQSTLDYS